MSTKDVVSKEQKPIKSRCFNDVTIGGNNQSDNFPDIPEKVTWPRTRLSTANHRRSSPIFFRRAGGCTQARVRPGIFGRAIVTKCPTSF